MVPICLFSQIDSKYVGKWEMKQEAESPEDHPSGLVWMIFTIDGSDSIVSVSKAADNPVKFRFVEEIEEISPDYFRIQHRMTYLVKGSIWRVFTAPESLGYTHFSSLKLIDGNTLQMTIDFQDGKPAKTFVLKKINGD